MTNTIVYHVGDVRNVVRSLGSGAVQSVISSPPYWRKRSYIDPTEPIKVHELGQEASPGEFIGNLLALTDDLWGVVADDGTIWINLGDTAAGSGGWGGDVDKTNRGGGRRWTGTNGSQTSGADMPRTKSICWIPELFGASLAYGRNILTGDACRQWITRPKVTWCKPTITPGRCDDRFRVATELIIWASKNERYWWDRAAILEPLADSPGNRYTRNVSSTDTARRPDGSTSISSDNRFTAAYDPTASAGAPPMDWWVIGTSRGVDTPDGAHFATYPIELIRRPILAACPEGGTILDPFGGSGTTGIAAALHGRNAVLIDLDPNNLAIARHRVRTELRLVDEQVDGDTTTWTVEAPLPNQRAQVDGQRSIFDELEAS